MNIGDQKSLELINTMLNDQDKEVVKNAVIAIYNIEGEDLIKEIISNSQSSEFAKIEAANLLNELSEEEHEEE
jgi:HEAT repeat protein